MMDIRRHTLWVLVPLLASCSKPDIPWVNDPVTQRWYSQAQVSEGKKLFVTHCASCHGRKAEGADNWIKPDAQGFYPPPPLNGTAHSWHHPYPHLVKTIREGTSGKMPPWKNVLTDEEISQTIAYFQSYWPDRAYQLWLQRHKR